MVDNQVCLSDAGILDILCVDEDGLPVAVEVKLARNGDERRVVAQIVDYLSSLTTLTVDEVDAALEGGLEDALRTFDHDNEDSREKFGARWRAFGANLRSGTARVVIVLDALSLSSK